MATLDTDPVAVPSGSNAGAGGPPLLDEESAPSSQSPSPSPSPSPSGAGESKTGGGGSAGGDDDGDSTEAAAAKLFSAPHPQLAAMRSQVDAIAAGAADCPLVVLMPDTKTPAGLPLGEGWTWKGVMAGPPGSLYAGMAVRLQLMMPKTWTPDGNDRPAVRVLGLMSHMHLDALGDVEAEVYNAMPDNNLQTVIRVLSNMFEAPVATDLPSEAQLQSMWRGHDPACVCHMFPIPYSQFLMHDRDTQKLELAKLLQRWVKTRQYRWQAYAQRERQRFEIIQAYRPMAKHPSLFDRVSPSWFDPEFLAAWETKSPDALRAILTKEVNGVYSFPLFTPAFCKKLAEEYDAYEASGLPASRPNSMNNYGLILNNIGLESVMDTLVSAYLKPVAAMLFPEHGGGTLDHHHTFLVAYELGADKSLDFHIDDADVTVNVNLVDKFDGAGLSFCGMQTEPSLRKHRLTYMHRLGRAVIHPGTLRHGAHEIEGGKRVNLIVWMRSAEHRRDPAFQHAYDRVDQSTPPDKICLSRKHDPDFAEQVAAAADVGGGAPPTTGS